jgi:hypothetical protein
VTRRGGVAQRVRRLASGGGMEEQMPLINAAKVDDVATIRRLVAEART